MNADKPIVICFSGLDPTGGAGIQADIETLQALGCHAAPVISSLTVQTTSNVRETHACDADLIRRQFDALIESDLTISAIKLGLIDNPAVMRCIADITVQLADVPLIADPVLKAGGGFEFGNSEMLELYRELILPRCQVLTPNTVELMRLSPLSLSDEEALKDLCTTGCEHILLTGTHRHSADVSNRLMRQQHQSIDKTWSWPRLPGEFHGSGCTLASAMAAGIAKGMDYITAAEAAQHFTWQALKHAIKAGNGQYLPDRRIHQQSSGTGTDSVC